MSGKKQTCHEHRDCQSFCTTLKIGIDLSWSFANSYLKNLSRSVQVRVGQVGEAYLPTDHDLFLAWTSTSIFMVKQR
jgi:hypothetical protein